MNRWTRPGLVALFATTVAMGAVLGVGAALTWPADRYRDNVFMGFWLGSRALHAAVGHVLAVRMHVHAGTARSVGHRRHDTRRTHLPR